MKPVLTPRPLRLVSAPDVDADQQLIDAIVRGDNSKARQLYERLRSTVSRAIRRAAPAELEHEDLVQQAFAEIAHALRARPRVRHLDGWASAIAVRAVYQRVRRTRLEDRFCVDAEGLEEVLDASTTTTTTSRDASHRLLLKKVLELVRALPNQNRVQVFVLHDVHGYELSEIAEILGITVANAQSRLVRGRSDVHEALAARPELHDALKEAP